jgi:hypothetical protein
MHFAHNFTWNHPAEYPFTPGTRNWSRKGAFAKTKSPGWPSVSDAAVDHIQACFQCSPQKSVRRASHELQLLQTVVSKIMRNHLLMKPYKLHLVQAMKTEDLAVRFEFCHEILASI